MRIILIRLAAVVMPSLLAGCLATSPGKLEVFDSSRAYGKTIAVSADTSPANEHLGARLALELREAFDRSGLATTDSPTKADLIVVPTIGKMRVSHRDATDALRLSASPRPSVTGGELVARRSTTPSRAPVNRQQAGLLLSAYPAREYSNYSVGQKKLSPVWRIYVSQPVRQIKWKTAAVPLIDAAARVAAPLGKSLELGAGSRERVKSSERRP